MTSLIDRAKGLILTPSKEWEAIEAEPLDKQAVLIGYVLPLAAIPLVASLIGQTLIGVPGYGQLPLDMVIGGVIYSFVASIAGVFVFAFILTKLAPFFDAEADFDRAFKVSAYTPTASWLAGIFLLLPFLGFLTLLGLYSLYLLFVGVPRLMKPPAAKATAYTLASIGVAIVLAMVFAAVQAFVVMSSTPAMG